jgi:hypothetical protein
MKCQEKEILVFNIDRKWCVFWDPSCYNTLPERFQPRVRSGMQRLPFAVLLAILDLN